jgi:hypothetical protein
VSSKTETDDEDAERVRRGDAVTNENMTLRGRDAVISAKGEASKNHDRKIEIRA